MASTSNFVPQLPLPDIFGKLAYQTFQQTKNALSLAHKMAASRLTEWVLPESWHQPLQELSPELLSQLKQMNDNLMERDWEDAQEGVYPQSLLFESQWDDFLRYYPQVWLELGKVWQRLPKKNYQHFDAEIETQGYPKYYLQNFHHQPNGYLSDRSAELYDLQVELLFNGCANAMRRRILAPLKSELTANFAHLLPQQIRVLDVACGTGYTLRALRATLPKASLFGLDLSPAYLRRANQLLSQFPGELPQLVQGKGEELPYLDQYFHAVTSVFLFHELPGKIRQQVIEEAFRVLKPNGVFIICDSMQAVDRPEFTPMMENFPTLYHEPYYRHYIHDDLQLRLEQAGFTDIRIENHLVSKYWIARRG
ncbi:class I SAM-dependent methyltransferase [Spirulina subsalsa]|uniref:class I SAM-dependent methyltransferase n=1 Tax=Spirulina subsalsa TaxID=54311 RepID=UPI0002EA408D|nr:class I SAM-dependent methyltransferase [Spirulina subsalsa]